jgi:hypothetical protein
LPAAADNGAVTRQITPGVPHIIQSRAATLDEGDAAMTRPPSSRTHTSPTHTRPTDGADRVKPVVRDLVELTVDNEHDAYSSHVPFHAPPAVGHRGRGRHFRFCATNS